MEAELLEAIDGLVVTSRPLAGKRVNGCPLLHLPHGVEFEHFRAAGRSEPEPRMEAIRRPVVGFFGLLSAWVDLGLIAHLSACFPECSFVLIGRAEVDLRPLQRLPNVHCLGWVPYADLPRYARYFDVGLIPFVLNRLTRAVNPLKLMEYFALGLPVLATRLPELERVPGPLRLAVTPDEFRAGLAELLRAYPGVKSEEAVAVARENTWDARAEQLSAFLEGLGPARA
jgi:glycosyltransferase involved in cell wall biosynthesis